MKYSHSFQVGTCLSTVAGFQAHASSLKAITPPPVVAQIHQAQVVDEIEAELHKHPW